MSTLKSRPERKGGGKTRRLVKGANPKHQKESRKNEARSIQRLLNHRQDITGNDRSRLLKSVQIKQNSIGRTSKWKGKPSGYRRGGESAGFRRGGESAGFRRGGESAGFRRGGESVGNRGRKIFPSQESQTDLPGEKQLFNSEKRPNGLGQSVDRKRSIHKQTNVASPGKRMRTNIPQTTKRIKSWDSDVIDEEINVCRSEMVKLLESTSDARRSPEFLLLASDLQYLLLDKQYISHFPEDTEYISLYKKACDIDMIKYRASEMESTKPSTLLPRIATNLDKTNKNDDDKVVYGDTSAITNQDEISFIEGISHSSSRQAPDSMCDNPSRPDNMEKSTDVDSLPNESNQSQLMVQRQQFRGHLGLLSSGLTRETNKAKLAEVLRIRHLIAKKIEEERSEIMKTVIKASWSKIDEEEFLGEPLRLQAAGNRRRKKFVAPTKYGS